MAQPWNRYPVLVGTVEDKVRETLYVFVCAEGAPEPPFALYETVYVFTFHTAYRVVVPDDVTVIEPPPV